MLEGRELRLNSDNLYIGGHPSYSQACNTQFFLDSLKIFKRVLPSHEIQAEVGNILGNYSPGEVLIACKNCDSVTAQ
jgi:hypothetical protein